MFHIVIVIYVIIMLFESEFKSKFSVKMNVTISSNIKKCITSLQSYMNNFDWKYLIITHFMLFLKKHCGTQIMKWLSWKLQKNVKSSYYFFTFIAIFDNNFF